MSLHKPR